MPRLLPLLLLVVTAAARAAEPEPIAIIPSMGAVQAGRSIAIWAPDLRSVLGYDASGKRLWRLATGDQGGLRDLDVIGDNVLVYAGSEAILVAPDSGKILGRRAHVALGSPGGPRGCRVRQEEGACALACECRFEIVSCADLSSLGEPALLPHFEELDADGQRSSHCPMFSGALLGRAGDAIITSFPAATDKPFFGVPEITIARHAKTGAELWRIDNAGFFDEALSGIAGDGVCYAGSRGGSLTAFDCEQGTVLWHRAIETRGEPQVEATPLGILARIGKQVARLDLRTGEPRWQVEVPENSLVLLAGLDSPRASHPPAPTDRRFGGTIRGARILAVADGKTLGDIRFLAGTARWPRRFGDGWIVLADKRLDAYDNAGKSLGGLGSSTSFSDYVLGSGPNVAAWDRNAVTLSALPSARPMEALNGSALSVVAYEGALGPGRLAVMVDGRGPWDAKKPETFGEVRVYRLGP